MKMIFNNEVSLARFSALTSIRIRVFSALTQLNFALMISMHFCNFMFAISIVTRLCEGMNVSVQ